jgi:hypothetical protein
MEIDKIAPRFEIQDNIAWTYRCHRQSASGEISSGGELPVVGGLSYGDGC